MLHMIELRPDIIALIRYLRDQGLEFGKGDDLGYGVHAWLSAAFGDMAPTTWRLFIDRRRPPRVLGYSHHSAAVLRQRLREFADPGLFAVTDEPDSMISSRPMPAFASERRLGFELLALPVGRKASTGTEKDLFLIRADASEGQNVEREAVYCDWARERLERENACVVTGMEMSGFRLTRMTRRQDIRVKGGKRGSSQIVRPQVLLRGDLIVCDPDAFATLLARGVGRHRAFGYGMLLLRPA
ncbi:MAG: type I-E CRISPR-associated protein Cas6/Cse3/CasE [Firmicutes bacterium]|nr:type I-E CRISPR-associated protein Cas6/Cse3/CasE [Bacillota bacterium]